MMHYDKMMDSISKEIYTIWEKDVWDDEVAKNKSYAILKIVEEFQQSRLDWKKQQWRASD
jgi:hypothetical protein